MDKIKKIEKAEIFIIRIPLIRPFETSFGIETYKEALVLRVKDKDNYGWGESVSSPEPTYSYETNKTTFYIIKEYLIPMVKSLSNFIINDALNIFNKIRGYNMAKATVENALFDLLARKKRIPLFELLGGENKKIMSGISLGIKKHISELLDLIQNSVDKKYKRIKIKIKRGIDLQVLENIRAHFPKIRLMVDANADYSINDIDHLKKFDRFNLTMIEQPLNFDDLYFHSILQKELSTPICLDESIKNLNDAIAAKKLKSCRIINIKQGRVGGLNNSNKIQDYCKKNNIKVWSGGMLETGIGRAFNLHLQTLPGFNLPGDTSETSRYFKEDIVEKPVTLDNDGLIEIPKGPGLGVKIIQKRLDKFKIFYQKI